MSDNRCPVIPIDGLNRNVRCCQPIDDDVGQGIVCRECAESAYGQREIESNRISFEYATCQRIKILRKEEECYQSVNREIGGGIVCTDCARTVDGQALQREVPYFIYDINNLPSNHINGSIVTLNNHQFVFVPPIRKDEYHLLNHIIEWSKTIIQSITVADLEKELSRHSAWYYKRIRLSYVKYTVYANIEWDHQDDDEDCKCDECNDNYDYHIPSYQRDCDCHYSYGSSNCDNTDDECDCTQCNEDDCDCVGNLKMYIPYDNVQELISKDGPNGHVYAAIQPEIEDDELMNCLNELMQSESFIDVASRSKSYHVVMWIRRTITEHMRSRRPIKKDQGCRCCPDPDEGWESS